MPGVVVLGEWGAVEGYALGGAHVVPAGSDDAVRAAWLALPDDVEVVVLTPAAAAALGPERTREPRPLSVVMPS